MDLSDVDVTDILALMDSLPYDELDVRTARFRLILRRTPDGWTQSTQVLSAPEMLESAPPPAEATASMSHRGGYNRHDVTSLRSAGRGDGDGGASETGGEAEGAPGGEAGARADAGAETEAGAGAGEAGAGAGEADAGAGEADAGAGEADAGLVAVRAPLPGTFYRAPRPGAAPFVEVGSRVSADTVIGIVETMKLMNSVPAGVAGTVAEFCLDNAEFAAHGATLLRIRADP
jgi:acetyl-CoA carboxylase biotin carboxyl carrier protein